MKKRRVNTWHLYLRLATRLSFDLKKLQPYLLVLIQDYPVRPWMGKDPPLRRLRMLGVLSRLRRKQVKQMESTAARLIPLKMLISIVAELRKHQKLLTMIRHNLNLLAEFRTKKPRGVIWRRKQDCRRILSIRLTRAECSPEANRQWKRTWS